MYTTLQSDARCALRLLLSQPLVTFAATVTLTLAIATITTLFAVINGVLLRPLPYPHSERLVMLWESDREQRHVRRGVMSSATLADIVASTTAIEIVGAVRNTSKSLTALEVPRTPLARQASESYFRLLGAQPIIGRTFVPSEDAPHGPRVVILSAGLWKDSFASDPLIAGKAIELDHEPHVVVGVLPPGFRSPIEGDDVAPQLWLPLQLEARSRERALRRLLVYGRLRDGVTVADARGELDALGARIEAEYPETNSNRTIELELLKETLVADSRQILGVLFVAGALLLSAACLNVGTLAFGSVRARLQPLATRMALGASASRILALLTVEQLLLAAPGGLLGLTLSWLLIQQMPTRTSTRLPFARLEHVDMDVTVVLFAVLITTITGLSVVAVASAGLLRHSSTAAAVNGNRSAGFSGAPRAWARTTLVTFEIAVAVVILIGGASMWKTYLALRESDPGFDASEVLTARVAPRGVIDLDPNRFFTEALQRISALPGVLSVGAASRVPLTNLPLGAVPFSIDGEKTPERHQEVLVRVVTPGFFETLRIPLIAGRLIDAGDVAGGGDVVVVNEELVRSHFAGEILVGRTLWIKFGVGRPTRVVGIVGNVRTLGNPPRAVPMAYLPLSQEPTSVLSLVIRTRLPTQSLMQEVGAVIGRLDPLAPVYEVFTMAELVEIASRNERLASWILAVISGVCFVIALAGLYALSAMTVEQRRREFAIRWCSGAEPYRLVLEATLANAKAAAAGIAGGLSIAVVVSGVIGSKVYGFGEPHVWIYAGVGFGVAVVSLIAVLVAARHAARVDPSVLLG